MAKKKRMTKKKTAKKTKTSKKKMTKKATKKAAKKVAKKSAKKATKKVTKKSAKSTAKKTTSVHVGEMISDLTLPSTGGKDVSLADLKGRKVVLYFYPKDATPGCTIEGHEFTQLHDAFKAANTEVFGVSRDSVKSHENFKNKESYSIDLLSDESESACQRFDVMKMKNMYGKQVRGVERSTFVIDEDGRLVKEWRGVKAPGHAAEVLEYVKSL